MKARRLGWRERLGFKHDGDWQWGWIHACVRSLRRAGARDEKIADLVVNQRGVPKAVALAFVKSVAPIKARKGGPRWERSGSGY